jgi:hypothetical protein
LWTAIKATTYYSAQLDGDLLAISIRMRSKLNNLSAADKIYICHDMKKKKRRKQLCLKLDGEGKESFFVLDVIVFAPESS